MVCFFKKIKIILLLFGLVSASYGGEEYLIKNYLVNDGLLQSTVLSFYQDSSGFLWIGTELGLSRFDGINFDNFKTDGAIKKIAEYKGRIIALDYNGHFHRIERGVFKTWNLLKNTDLLFTDFIITTEDSILLGSTEGPLYMYGGADSMEAIRLPSNFSVWNMDINSEGMVYVNSTDGVFELNSRNVIEIFRPEKYAVRQIFLSDDDNLVMSQDGNGVFLMNKEGRKKIYSANYFFTNTFDSDQNGFIWGASNKGLFRYNLSDEEVSLLKVIENQDVLSVFCDRDGNIWCGTRGNGLFRVSKNYFSEFSSGHSGPVLTRPVYQENRDNIWFETADGSLLKYNRGVIKSFIGEKYFPNRHINNMTIYEGKHLLSCGHRIIYFSEEGYKDFNMTGLPPGPKFILFTDSKERLWTSVTGSGIYYFEDQKWHEKEIEFPSGRNSSVLIFEDSLNNLWLATVADQMYMIGEDEVIRFDDNAGIKGDYICVIKEDHLGRLWVGTFYGIFIFENQKLVEVINENNGLISPRVYALLKYKDMMLIGTSDGFGIYHKGQFRFFSSEDGLTNNDISGASMFADSKGNILMGTTHNISSFAIEDYLDKRENYNIYFRSVVSEKDTIDISRQSNEHQVILSGNRRNIKLYFERIELNGKNGYFRYRWITEEKKGIWKETSKKFVTADYLGPGEYTLEVQCKKPGGQWNNAGLIKIIKEREWISGIVIAGGLIVAFLTGLIIWGTETPEPKKYSSSSLSGKKISEIKERLNEIMKEEKLFRDPAITLSLVSSRLNISREHLSQVINSEFGCNFNDYVNRFRIEDAKILLREDGKKLQILEIVYVTGFNNKTSFNSSFKKLTGMTPTEYRKKQLIS